MTKKKFDQDFKLWKCCAYLFTENYRTIECTYECMTVAELTAHRRQKHAAR